jgi:16S rRNA G966 N2-methylase RsmD
MQGSGKVADDTLGSLPMAEPQKNALYYGDNLAVLREYIPDNSVDLIYLDPPFNSRQDLIGG